MKLLLALGAAVVIAAGCTKPESKSTASPTASVAPQVKLEGQPQAAIVPSVIPNKKVCVKGAEKHEFDIQKNGSGCILNSIDAGKIKEEALGRSGTRKCERQEKHLIAKLSRAGFQCQ
jgi:hypothetical protein